MLKLEEVLQNIVPTEDAMEEAAWKHWDSLAKPLRGMGMLEEMVVRLARIYGTDKPMIHKKAVVVMGADNGVVEEGVTQTGSEVTACVLENMGEGKSSVCLMAKVNDAEVFPVNIGMLTDAKHPRILNVPVRYGTANMAKGPAMTREEAVRAMEQGIAVVGNLKEQGYDLFVTGEMGIGNTTSSSACTAVMLDTEVELVTGRGAGLSNEGLQRKIEVIKRAIALNRPDRNDPLDVVSKVGGLDIAGLMGCYLGAAYYQVPILIDGLISSIAAYMAYRLCPAAKDYMVATHVSAEPAGKMVMDALGMEAPIHAGLHLGEGTGAVTALSLYEYAFRIYYGMPTFQETAIEEYQPFS
ncbi:MAG: nicotinate-nucleotide--dimethylbenzimidazole phosphoribosyltransferase [Lachnospiraceae bacterium]